MLAQFIHILLHLDVYLQGFFLQYGMWIYALLFSIIFLESGVILTAFLPGDSLLFATGTIAAASALNIHLLVGLLIVAAITGAVFNYALGAWVGPKIFNKPKTVWFNPEHIQRSHDFFERYGWGAIIITRFIPIMRTFIPFVAGIGRMGFKKFIFFNGLAALIWIGGILYLSYAFGQLPWIKAHFSWIVMGIILVSLIPVVVTFLNQKLAEKRKLPHVVD
ncbi:MAG: hypothetical protein K0R48_976 [Gammaproteobacteria bacterium]|jgi:membrane-associated protein|nr:hypothetical protein [Gammaproteobacteria bacterium]